MVKFQIKVTNSTKLRRQLTALPDDIRKGIRQAVKESAAAIKRDARKRVAVDSGDLRKSIKYRVDADGLGAVVKAEEYYGVFVEFGTTSMKAQPFMRPAAEAERARFPNRVSEDVRKALGLK